MGITTESWFENEMADISRGELVELKTEYDKLKKESEELKKQIENMKINKNSGSYQCFHCLQQAVIWDNDFDFSDFGYEGEGIVHYCHCANCGAEIEYKISFNDEE